MNTPAPDPQTAAVRSWEATTGRLLPCWLGSAALHLAMLLLLGVLTLGSQLLGPVVETVEARHIAAGTAAVELVIWPGTAPEHELADGLFEFKHIDSEVPANGIATIYPASMGIVETNISSDAAVGEASAESEPGCLGDPSGNDAVLSIAATDWQPALELPEPPSPRGRLNFLTGPPPIAEGSISAGLYWLAPQQGSDGGWPADADQASQQERTAATALALLTLIGAGQTHRSGKFKREVAAGLRYLQETIALHQRDGATAWCSQALVALVLCEHYGMTGNPELQPLAQRALDHLCAAQDSRTGTWRQPDGNEVSASTRAWIALALRSGQLAKLRVSPSVIQRLTAATERQCAELAQLQNTRPSAATLVPALFFGSTSTQKLLERGIDQLADAGPNPARLQETFFATLLIQLRDHSVKQAWYTKLRNQLAAAQVKRGSDRGSWPNELNGDADLQRTAINIMALEIYYRHLPIYDRLK